jgi:hypothetical protein
MPRLRSTRPVENRPEFRLDIAATINTPWTRASIHDNPIAPNTVTNGLIPGTYRLVGSIEHSSRIEPQQKTPMRKITALTAFGTSRRAARCEPMWNPPRTTTSPTPKKITIVRP